MVLFVNLLGKELNQEIKGAPSYGLLSSFSFKLSDEETMCRGECFENIYIRDGLERFNE